LRKWWERWPGLLEYELDQLRAAGIPFELDEEALARGIVVIRLSPTIDGEPLELVARFPDLYPYFRFDISAPKLDLVHHQHPFSKSLCLLGRATGNWNVEDTLAEFITDRLPKTLKGGRSDNLAEVESLEEHQGEPYSDYYPYFKDSIVLVDSSWSIDLAIAEGKLFINLEGPFKPNVKSREPKLLLRGAVDEIYDQTGNVIAKADPLLAECYTERMQARWVRLAEPIREQDSSRLHELLAPKDRELQKTRWKRVAGGLVDIVGILFPEETSWRKNSDGWVFAILVRPNSRDVTPYSILVRAGRAGRGDLAARVPSISSLEKHNITLIGLGAVGAPSAIEFAKCGIGQLRIIDPDFVDPGTISRWPIGIVVAGLNKVDIIQEYIEASYPYTKVIPYIHRIGVVYEDAPNDLKVMDEVLADANLVYDASAEDGLNHFLSDLASEQRIPYIRISTTPGAWGGYIARIHPGKTEGCWVCLKRWFQDEEIPLPPFDPAGEVQPAGCADPTFTGTSFDIAEISLMGVRVAVSTLTSEVAGGYPEIEWDVAVLFLRDDDGNIIPPSWKTYSLRKHPKCKSEIHQV
jgi:hypothetical protein